MQKARPCLSRGSGEGEERLPTGRAAEDRGAEVKYDRLGGGWFMEMTESDRAEGLLRSRPP